MENAGQLSLKRDNAVPSYPSMLFVIPLDLRPVENSKAEMTRRRERVKETRLRVEALGVNIREILDTLGVVEWPEELHPRDLGYIREMPLDYWFTVDNEAQHAACERYIEASESLAYALVELNPKLKPRYRLRLERLGEGETIEGWARTHTVYIEPVDC